MCVCVCVCAGVRGGGGGGVILYDKKLGCEAEAFKSLRLSLCKYMQIIFKHLRLVKATFSGF